MSYQAITNTEIAAGGPIDATLLGKVKNNFDDHEIRIEAAGTGGGGASQVQETFTYASGSAFDLSKSASIAVTAPSGSAFTLNNIADGAAYTLAFQDNASVIVPSFSYTKAENGAATGLTLFFSPSLAQRTFGKHWVASIVRVGNFVYINSQEF